MHTIEYLQGSIYFEAVVVPYLSANTEIMAGQFQQIQPRKA
jgi:hypothetical protein